MPRMKKMFKTPKHVGLKKMTTKGVRSEGSKAPPFLKKSKKKQHKVGMTERGETHLAPYGIGADMSQSPNY